MKTFIETERLILREIVEDDAKGILQLDGDPLVLNYIAQKPITNLNQAKDTIAFIGQQYVEYGIGRWALIDKDLKCFIGWAGFKFITTPVNNNIHCFDLGYRLIRDYWGRGYTNEAATSCINYAFQKLLLEEIYAIADIENLASIKILERVGLKKIESFIYESKPHYWFKLIQQEWLHQHCQMC